MNTLTVVVTATFLVGCVSTPGANPHDMSAAQHQAAANDHDQLADAHAGQYSADASATVWRCSRRGACWTSTTNPTAAHQDEAKKHQRMAADHRAASQALRDAEARACVGLADEDRDSSPFDHRDDIASVEPLSENVSSGKGGQPPKMTGAVITFRALPGLTAEWLQRVVDCHLARNAALGHDVPEMPSCPLVPKNVTARVTSTGAGFAVAVRSDDSDTAVEVLRRARSLVAR